MNSSEITGDIEGQLRHFLYSTYPAGQDNTYWRETIQMCHLRDGL